MRNRFAWTVPIRWNSAAPGGAAGRDDGDKAHVLKLDQLRSRVIDLVAAFGHGKLGPGNDLAVDKNRAVVGRAPGGSAIARPPASRQPPVGPARVLHARAISLQIVLGQLDEAARGDRAGGYPPSAAPHHGGHDRMQLEDVAVPDEPIQLGGPELLPLPGPAGQFQQDSQRQAAVPAQQQPPRLGPEEPPGQVGGGRFRRA